MSERTQGMSIAGIDMEPMPQRPSLRARLTRAVRQRFFCKRDKHRETVVGAHISADPYIAYQCIDCGWLTRFLGGVCDASNLPTPDDTDAIQAMIDRGEAVTHRKMRLTRPLRVNDWLKPVLFSHNRVRTSADALFVGTFPPGSELTSCVINGPHDSFQLVRES